MTAGGLQAVLFDFDGTLAVLQIDFDRMRRSVRDLVPQFASDYPDGGALWTLELIDAVFVHLGAQDGDRARQFRSAALQLVQDVELDAARTCRWLPGVDEALRTLRESGLRVGVVTRNCRRAVESVAGPAEQWCDALFTRDDVSRVKPDPEHLVATLRALSVSPATALMVGDHPSDIRVANFAGLRGVGVLTGRASRDQLMEAGAIAVLPSVARLPEWLEGLRIDDWSNRQSSILNRQS